MRLGIVGFGHVGRAIAQRALAFEMVVSYYKRRRLAVTEERELGVSYVDLPEMIAEVDVLGLAAATSGNDVLMLGDEQLSRLKVGAFVINVARAALVDQGVLVRLVAAGLLGGVGLDVVDGEPEPTWPEDLAGRIIITPHIAGRDRNAVTALNREVVRQLVEFVRA